MLSEIHGCKRKINCSPCSHEKDADKVVRSVTSIFISCDILANYCPIPTSTSAYITKILICCGLQLEYSAATMKINNACPYTDRLKLDLGFSLDLRNHKMKSHVDINMNPYISRSAPFLATPSIPTIIQTHSKLIWAPAAGKNRFG